MPRLEAASISSTSNAVPARIARQFSQVLSGVRGRAVHALDAACQDLGRRGLARAARARETGRRGRAFRLRSPRSACGRPRPDRQVGETFGAPGAIEGHRPGFGESPSAAASRLVRSQRTGNGVWVMHGVAPGGLSNCPSLAISGCRRCSTRHRGLRTALRIFGFTLQSGPRRSHLARHGRARHARHSRDRRRQEPVLPTAGAAARRHDDRRLAR